MFITEFYIGYHNKTHPSLATLNTSETRETTRLGLSHFQKLTMHFLIFELFLN